MAKIDRWIKCAICGGDVMVHSNRAIYCRPCYRKVQAENTKRNMRLKREEERANRQPLIMHCVRCGKEIGKTKHNRLYCSMCQHDVKLESSRRNYEMKRGHDAKGGGVVKSYKLIFDPSGDYTLGASFDYSAMPGYIATNYDAWAVGTRWAHGGHVFEYQQYGKKLVQIT